MLCLQAPHVKSQQNSCRLAKKIHIILIKVTHTAIVPETIWRHLTPRTSGRTMRVRLKSAARSAHYYRRFYSARAQRGDYASSGYWYLLAVGWTGSQLVPTFATCDE